jgi:transcriptional regulator with XRE-family HTH domain
MAKGPVDIARYELVNFLFQARLEKGLTQKQLAKRMGVSRTTVTQLELMYYECRFSTLARWAEALGYEIRLELKSNNSATHTPVPSVP